MNNIDKVTFTISQGRFDLFEPRKTSWRVVLSTPLGVVTAHSDDKPNFPSEGGIEDMIITIRDCWAQYIYTSFKTKGEPILKEIEDRLDEMEILWWRSELPRLQAKAANAHKSVDRAMRVILAIQACMAQ